MRPCRAGDTHRAGVVMGRVAGCPSRSKRKVSGEVGRSRDASQWHVAIVPLAMCSSCSRWAQGDRLSERHRSPTSSLEVLARLGGVGLGGGASKIRPRPACAGACFPPSALRHRQTAANCRTIDDEPAPTTQSLVVFGGGRPTVGIGKQAGRQTHSGQGKVGRDGGRSVELGRGCRPREEGNGEG